MKALVYNGPGKKALEDRPNPDVAAPTDAIVKIVKTSSSLRIDSKLDEILDAYETLGAGAKSNALKVLIEA